MTRKFANHHTLLVALAVTVGLTMPAVGQQPGGGGNASPGGIATRTLAPGVATRIEGIIVSVDAGGFRLEDDGGSEIAVVVTGQTRFKERKSNPFRNPERYSVETVVKGLLAEVRGKGDSSGALLAEEVRFTQDDLKFARSLQTRVSPVESRLTETEGRLKRSEQEAQHMASQVDELAAISNAARGGAKAAQESADAAERAAELANSGVRAANERISLLDEFEVLDNASLRFKAASSVLTPEARGELDRLASHTRSLSGYVIEVTGYASSDGKESFNLRLSEQRASVVVRYLVERAVPLRRIITPFGFGAQHPVADNSTRDGRSRNRRVDVRVLVSKGALQKADASATLRTNAN